MHKTQPTQSNQIFQYPSQNRLYFQHYEHPNQELIQQQNRNPNAQIRDSREEQTLVFNHKKPQIPIKSNRTNNRKGETFDHSSSKQAYPRLLLHQKPPNEESFSQSTLLTPFEDLERRRSNRAFS
ncbi:hypothetical protein Syun_015979 [Stephania yunnanensis]|uniref:Uncharacterized protein n=1 Tax=Stephania yunnanensis TaxID=152371 RepID=A0AAP0J3Y7_9MAGN